MARPFCVLGAKTGGGSVLIVLTGASGFVARMLVPRLLARGHDLRLVTDRPEVIIGAWPTLPRFGTDDLATAFSGADCVVHLAARNNNRSGTLAEFRADNVEAAVRARLAARAAGVQRFIFASSINAARAKGGAPYDQTKHEAEQALLAADDPTLSIYRLGTVHAAGMAAGRLGRAQRLPVPLRPIALSVLMSLRPTTSIGRLCDAIETGGPGFRVLTDRQDDSVTYAFAHRAFDLLFSAIVIFGFWWLLLGIWVGVKLGSPGPGVLAQDRVGRNGRIFRCYKFRTMAEGTKVAGTHEVPESAVTPIGRILRRAKLDELPQVLNLIRGDMAFVGPRPCLPVQTDLIAARQARGVLKVRPGITGWAQVNGIDMRDPERLARVDEDWLNERSLPLDAKIILATFLGRRVLRGVRIGGPSLQDE
ncbi:sugar transferase [Marivivens marinus]|uniref:sugar transferase n=1 Tax=Marivivens marinus TaxID=3110173 RepID=UPI003B8494D0